MKITTISCSEKSAGTVHSDLLIVCAAHDEKNKINLSVLGTDIINSFKLEADFKAEADEKLLVYTGSQGDIACSRVALVGLGNCSEIKENTVAADLYRRCGGNVAGICKEKKITHLSVEMPEYKGVDQQLFAKTFVEGLQLGLYTFDKYKKNDEKAYKGLKKLSLCAQGKTAALKKYVDEGMRAALAGCTARNMANEPGNGWTPGHFAQFARKLAKKSSAKCTILELSDMLELKMGGILAVNQGSHEEPKLVILDYKPKKYKETVMLVGKGLTFDSGGVSLKPAQGMMDMKYDMCGGAAVLSAMQALVQEDINVRVVCLVPSTDNMSGGGAVKPGDVITHYGGITSEIENTDAEGRLILADALAYGIATYSPDCVIDLATLTGAVVIALGHHNSGIMSNNDKLVQCLTDAGAFAGEPLWRLPLGTDYAKQIKSKVADIKNTGGRPGGSITAAEYLHKFVGDTPWAHIDIAGTAWDFTEKSYIPEGASGIGVRTLVECIRNWKNGKIRK